MFALTIVTAFFGLTLASSIPQEHLVYPKLDGRIVGGKDTTIEEHPYQVSVQLFGGHWCGGSLLRSNVVLTAAHCTSGRTADQFTVRAGSTRKNSGGELANVISICDHPDYYPYDYDVSVLHLDRSLPFGPGIKIIGLQSVGVEVDDGTTAVVTGWGALSSGGGSPTILQEVSVPKVSVATCQANYPGQGRITDRMHCFGYPEGGKDSCQGDSGGPLIVGATQVGIVSWGVGCAGPNKPGVYTKISSKTVTDHINKCLAKF